MDFQVGTMLVQVIGLLFYAVIIVAVVSLIGAIFKIRNNTTEMNKRLEAIERKLDQKN
ncbi:hypothetical protein [Tumebacillus avium]|uniref:hypothetical protein n=1 Tax=Tumebacillus avium TaxID=1903704 RepID=UPI0012FE56C0|nr:hypothetical protein [Tumebacillus avium]